MEWNMNLKDAFMTGDNYKIYEMYFKISKIRSNDDILCN